jgi:hypothetical protein
VSCASSRRSAWINVAGNEAVEDRKSLWPKSQNSVRNLNQNTNSWRVRGQCTLTWHDVGCDNSVRRPAVLGSPAYIGSNCNEFLNSSHLSRTNEAHSSTRRPTKFLHYRARQRGHLRTQEVEQLGPFDVPFLYLGHG